MPIRITGMNSGLDTESIITALTSTKKTKLQNFQGDQKKLSWKQDKLKELNKKVVSFYNGALSSMRFSNAYTKKTTSASNSNAVSIVTAENAMNSTQTLDITELAKASYLTGNEVKVNGESAKASTSISDLGINPGDQIKFQIGDDKNDILAVDIAQGDTISSILSKLKGASSSVSGTKLDFNYDEKNGRFYVASQKEGAKAAFHIKDATNAMQKLGLTLSGDSEENSSNYVAGTSAKIKLNGVEYTSENNVFEINGLTITAKEKATGVTLSTQQDTSGIYDNVKKLIKEYNDLMKEFATLYNADPAKKYSMLTDEQKEELSDKEVEEWENKIKDGLLSRDENIGNLRNSMKDIMIKSFDVTLKDGTSSKLSLASFGISTGSYFNTEENERDVFHIDGDPDDSTTSGNTDLLKAAISSDPGMVQSFFTELSKSLYSRMGDLMKGTQYSSAYTIYEDKLMASQYSAYSTKISNAQKALEAAQDKYYKQFSTMETTLSKINSASGSLSSFFGGG